MADALSRGVSAILPAKLTMDYASVAAAQEDDPELQELINGTTALQIRQMDIQDSSLKIWCDVSCGQPRPYIPPDLRQEIFHHFHSLAHPGIRGTQSLIGKRVVWPNMRKDIRQWTRECIHCQSTKIYKHIKSPLESIPTPTQRFHTIHVDIVGPLPASRGCRFILTCIDHVTRWAEAIPMPDSTAACTAHYFLAGWVSRFGAPHTIITDRGVQFESHIWRDLLAFLNTKRHRTTAYHPQSNGMVERFHRRLKEALRAHQHPCQWVETLPIILLTLRTTEKEDIKHSPAELVYGEDLRLPGQFTPPDVNPHPLSFLPALRQAMSNLPPTQPRPPPQRSTYVPMEVKTAEHVLLRHDTHRGPLARPYDGPYHVFRVQINVSPLIGTANQPQSV